MAVNTLMKTMRNLASTLVVVPLYGTQPIGST